ncbi:hypothetical protein, partial [Spirosoma areae]
MKKLYLLLFTFLLLTAANAQISLVKGFDPCCRVGPFESLNNLIIFNANDKLWCSDGTTVGTTLLTASAKFSNASYNRCRVGNTIFFWADNVNELWKTDGTIAGTVLVKALGFGFQAPLVSVNGLLLFGFKTDATGTEIWRSDGTDAGTYMVTDLNPGPGNGISYNSQQSSVVDGYFYFSGPSVYTGDPGFGYRPALYRTDGTAAGTTRVTNSGYSPFGINVINGKLIYQAYYPYTDTYGYPCFPYEPTVVTQFPAVLLVVENGVSNVLKYPANVPYCGKSIPAGNTFLNSHKFIRSSNYLYFIGQTEVVGGNVAYNLWRTNGTTDGTIQLTDFVSGSNEGPFGSMFSHWEAYDYNFADIAYFPIYTSATGSELWRSDGTSGGTYLVKDINPGPGGSGLGSYNGTGNPNNNTGPLELRSVNGTTYFFASEGVNGIELWKTNGTSNGTQIVQNLNPAGDQPISNLWNDNVYGTSVGNKFYFYGYNGVEWGLFVTSDCPSPPNVSIAATPSLTITQGSSTTLTASGATNYIWNTGATTPAIAVGPTSTTT